MARRLRSGAPRLLGRHDGARGRQYDAHFKALEKRLGPFEAMARDYAGSVAVLWLQWKDSAQDLAAKEDLWKRSRSRRPGLRALERSKRRAGLAWLTYDSAVRRLEELARQRRPRPLAELPVLSRGDGRDVQRPS